MHPYLLLFERVQLQEGEEVLEEEEVGLQQILQELEHQMMVNRLHFHLLDSK